MRRIDAVYVAIGIVYLVAGMALGIVMGIRQDFQLAPVHAHINLVGFVSHCVFGLVHRAWPALRAGTRIFPNSPCLAIPRRSHPF